MGLGCNCLVCLCKSMPVCLHVQGRNKIVNFIIYINLTWARGRDGKTPSEIMFPKEH